MGACACGAVGLAVRHTRPPRRQFLQHCHCSMCRRAGGATLQTWVGFPKEAVRWEPGDALRKVPSSAHAERGSCEVCGSSVTLEYRSQGDTTWLAACVFPQEAFAGARAVHICCASAPAWDAAEAWPPDGLRRAPYADHTVS